MMKRIAWGSIALLALAGAGRVNAAFVTYTETAVATGSLGTSTFANATITINGTADTTNVVNTAAGIYIILTTAMVNVSNSPTATFTDTIQAVSNQNVNANSLNMPLAGFGDVTNNSFLLGNGNVAFATYDLKSSIGPLSGAPLYNPGLGFATTAGKFIITSVSSASFSAVVSSSAIPEPASIGLLGVGLGVALAAARAHPAPRRTRQARA